jgi:VanZ family protein
MLGVLFLTLMKPSNLPLVQVNDKFAHLITFFVLIYLADYAYTPSAYKISKTLYLVLFGLMIEIAQYYTSWRSAEWQDLLADIVGILIYWPLSPLIQKLAFWR